MVIIAAAEMSGASWLRVLVRHVAPNVMSFLLVSASLQVASAIMSESFLIFLGLSVKTGGGEPNWAVTAYLSGGVLAASWLAVQLESRRPIYRGSVGRSRHYRPHLGPLLKALTDPWDLPDA